MKGLNFNSPLHFWQRPNKPGYSQYSFGNSRQVDCSGFSPAFLLIFSIVDKTEEGGIKRCPHKGQSAVCFIYSFSSKSQIRRIVTIHLPGHNNSFSGFRIMTSPELDPKIMLLDDNAVRKIIDVVTSIVNCFPVVRSQRMQVVSLETEIALLPSGVIETSLTASVCPLRL